MIHRVSTLSEALSALATLDSASRVGLDLETMPNGREGTHRYRPGLDPFFSRTRLIQLGTAEDAWVLDTQRVSPVPWLWWLRENPQKLVAQNGRFDLGHLQQAGTFLPYVWDTMLADQLLRPGQHGSSLKDLSERYLGEQMDKTEQTSDWAGDLTDAQIEYAGRDVLILPRLHAALSEKLKAQKLTQVARLEFAAVPAFAMLSRSGFVLDRDHWEDLTERAEATLAQAEQDLLRILPGPPQQAVLFGEGEKLNLLSPEQVKDALGRLGLPVESTNEHVLRGLDHPAAQLLLKHREMATFLKMFGRPMPAFVHPDTGRIHAEFWQLGAASGRTTSSNPNMQQLPHDLEIRSCFRAAEGCRLVIADYSQIELRIAAEISGDPAMIEAFTQGEDIHRRTASLVTGKAPEEVTKGDRQLAKAINFGLAYGMQAAGFQGYARDAYGVTVTAEEAVAFRDRFFAGYQGLARWHRIQTARAKKAGAVRTLSGRLRTFEKVLLTTATNTPVQGTGADMLKVALGTVAKEAWKHGWNLVGEVHDEIVLEVPEGETEEAAKTLERCMVEAGKRFLHKVPVEAEASVGETWADK